CRNLSAQSTPFSATTPVRSGPAIFSDLVVLSMPATEMLWQRLHFWARKSSLPSAARAGVAAASIMAAPRSRTVSRAVVELAFIVGISFSPPRLEPAQGRVDIHAGGRRLASPTPGGGLCPRALRQHRTAQPGVLTA